MERWSGGPKAAATYIEKEEEISGKTFPLHSSWLTLLLVFLQMERARLNCSPFREIPSSVPDKTQDPKGEFEFGHSFPLAEGYKYTFSVTGRAESSDCRDGLGRNSWF